MDGSEQRIRTDTSQQMPYGAEHDACALIVSVRKRGESTHGTLKRALAALAQMGHRTGLVNGEGDGAGVQTDIPRHIWAKALSQAGLRSSLATDPHFWVGHLFIDADADIEMVRNQISQHLNRAGLNLLLDQPGRVRTRVLGSQARQDAPTFWQIAGLAEENDIEARLFHAQQVLEESLPVHFASLSSYSVVYKVRGSVEVLPRFYPDLQDRNFDTAVALCHARYSTNTASNFARVQPFALLGHNGEINTIKRFRHEAIQLGAALDPHNSDSQDVDRMIHTLCVEYGMDLPEAMEIIFPPVPHVVDQFPPGMRSVYTRLRQAFGPYAQGPAAIVARYGDRVVCSVDALGLRPLWLIETEKEFVFSSERGVVPLDNMVVDARPLAPGEKVALRVKRGESVSLFDHAAIRQHVMERAFQRDAPRLVEHYWAGWSGDQPPEDKFVPTTVDRAADSWPSSPPRGGAAVEVARPQTRLLVRPEVAPAMPWSNANLRPIDTPVLAATGWNREHLQEIDSLATAGKDLVGSLGHDGPLAVLSQHRVNVADFFKETVAVVTNPAIDREREAEVFSTRTLVGMRPPLAQLPEHDELLVALETPLLSGGHPVLGDRELAEQAATAVGSLSIDGLMSHFSGRYVLLTLGVYADESVEQALSRLADEAILAVQGGAQCLVLDDAEMLESSLGWLDPHMAVARVDIALRDAQPDQPLNLRRRASIVVRSASVRTLHDIVMLYGFGADAINPYAMLAAAFGGHKSRGTVDRQDMLEKQIRLLRTLTVGLEKVISTIGCHELRGYGRVFSAIGLAPEVAALLQVPNYFGQPHVGLNAEWLERESRARQLELAGAAKAQLARVDRLYPKFYKKVQAVAQGTMTLCDFTQAYGELATSKPVALRHTLGFKTVDSTIDPADVDISIGSHSLPLLISAMSFGSQGELAYRAYAEAAKSLNMLTINGEGGELPDMIDQFTPYRGQQVASGRFGVNAQFLNSAWVIEIKVGQGAKPGEGGLLPAAKVTPQVALARRTNPHVPLISPSNNHDIYSIEDLAQLIEELKTVNPYAKVSVKIPVVPGVGVIAVGVAKAGADVINMTGYDGATGAARRHALQYVGLPAEIGVIQAHRALIDAGLRHRVELWCDGGMKSGADALKMILLGANRVGFGTMAMVAVGCTICRKCHEGTCHVGITTHIKTVDEAKDRGLKSFVPRDYDASVEAIERVFTMIADELRELTAQLGATRLQDLVGRADLLEQVNSFDRVDLSPALVHVPVKRRVGSERGVGRRLTRPRNNLTKTITDQIRQVVADCETEVTYQDEVMAQDRVLGSHSGGGTGSQS
jgi:glutamate synthase (NADPH/NADH) large chain